MIVDNSKPAKSTIHMDNGNPDGAMSNANGAITELQVISQQVIDSELSIPGRFRSVPS
jgi:hypothetical protein